MQLTEYTLKELWEIFVDDRPFGPDAIFRKIMSNTKQCSPLQWLLMDKIRGWENEERWVGSQFAACMWVYTKEALTRRQILDREEEKPEETNDVLNALHKLGLCWCFRWSLRTMIQKEEEILSMHGIGFQNRCSVRGTMVPLVVISSIVLSWMLLYDHFWKTNTEVVHVDIGGKGPTQYTQEVKSKHRDGRMDDKMESCTLFFWWWRRKQWWMICNTGSRGLFQLKNSAQGVPVVFMLIPNQKKTVQR